jgi:hypothetical protein
MQGQLTRVVDRLVSVPAWLHGMGTVHVNLLLCLDQVFADMEGSSVAELHLKQQVRQPAAMLVTAIEELCLLDCNLLASIMISSSNAWKACCGPAVARCVLADVMILSY